MHTMDAHGEEVACVQRRAWMELPQNRFLRGIYLLVQRYLRHNVGMQGAALAFYLLFMISDVSLLSGYRLSPRSYPRGQYENFYSIFLCLYLNI